MGKSQWVNFCMPKLESNVIAHKKPKKRCPTILELGKRDLGLFLNPLGFWISVSQNLSAGNDLYW